jgi:hypothetical protein
VVKGEPFSPFSNLLAVLDLEFGFHFEKGFLMGRFKFRWSFGSSYQAATFAWWRYLSGGIVSQLRIKEHVEVSLRMVHGATSRRAGWITNGLIKIKRQEREIDGGMR